MSVLAEDPSSVSRDSRLPVVLFSTRVTFVPLPFSSPRVSAHVNVPMSHSAGASWDAIDVLSTLWFRHSVATVKGSSRLVEGVCPVVNRPFGSSHESEGFHIRVT